MLSAAMILLTGCDGSSPAGLAASGGPKFDVKLEHHHDVDNFNVDHTNDILHVVSHDDRTLTVSEIIVNNMTGTDCDFSPSNPPRGYNFANTLPATLNVGGTIEVITDGCGTAAKVLIKTDQGDAEYDIS